ncbi:MAG: DUF4194 domain-containing protein [Spirochaetia bacterium]|jgi:hypothetical protein|nr:DUF4194 domain-containing protein [Spirochaetia bacterium]
MTIPPYAPSLVRLLKGPVYSDAENVWDMILRHRLAIDDYFVQVGLELVVAEHDGLAFLRRRRGKDSDEPADDGLPELVAKRELPYTASLLCVLLVEELYRFEAGSSGESRLVLDRAKIRDLAAPYLAKKTNEAKQADALDTQINRLIGYGFLRPIGTGSDELEVTKLLKYKIGADVLATALERLTLHAGSDAE